VTCSVCHWQPATRKGRCNACRLFLYRNGRDKTPAEVQAGWNRAVDKVARIGLSIKASR